MEKRFLSIFQEQSSGQTSIFRGQLKFSHTMTNSRVLPINYHGNKPNKNYESVIETSAWKNVKTQPKSGNGRYQKSKNKCVRKKLERKNLYRGILLGETIFAQFS